MIFNQHLVRTVFVQLPFLMVFVAVIIMAALRHKKNPAVTTLVIVAMSVFILSTILNIAAGYLPALLRGPQVASPSPLGAVIGYASLVTGTISAAGWILLVAAVFIDRNKPAPVEAEPKEA